MSLAHEQLHAGHRAPGREKCLQGGKASRTGVWSTYEPGPNSPSPIPDRPQPLALCHRATLTRFSLEEPGWKLGDSRDSTLGTLFLPILPPVPQLGVDEPPHEPGLGHTHQQQHAEPVEGETDLRAQVYSLQKEA